MSRQTSSRSTRRLGAVVGALAVFLGVLVAGQAPAAAELPGAVKVVAETPLGPGTTKTARARCPRGTRVTGGAGQPFAKRAFGRGNGLGGRIVLTRLRPVHTNRDWFAVTAAESELGFARDWGVRAVAFCASPLPGQQIVSRTVRDGGLPRQTAEAECPAGQRMIGAGGRIRGGRGQVQLAHSIVDVTGAEDPFSRAVGLEDDDGFTGRWSVTTHAICVDSDVGPIRFRSNFERSPVDTTDRKVVTAECPPPLPGPGSPSAKRVVSSGAQISGPGAVNAVIESIVPTTVGIGGRGRGPVALPNGIRVVAQERPGTTDDRAGAWRLSIVVHCG